MKFTHGTSFHNLAGIVTNGLNPNQDKIWQSFSRNACYLYSAQELVAQDLCDDIEEAEERIFSNAAESSMFAAVLHPRCRRVVIEFDIPKSFVEKHMDSDGSTGAPEGAMECFETVPPKYITRIRADKEDMPSLRCMFASQCLFSDDMTLQLERSLSDIEMRFVNTLKDDDGTFFEFIYALIDEMVDIDISEV